MDQERRIVTAPMELRKSGDKTVIAGTAAKFDSLSMPMGFSKFREKIDHGAFEDDMANPNLDCRALINHNPDHIIGRTTAGTLKLHTDKTGLKFEVDPPDTSYGRDLKESIGRGDISQCSFSFRVMPNGDDWSQDDASGNPIRTLRKVSIHHGDVSPVTFPAYPDTEVNMRFLEATFDAAMERLYFEGASEFRDSDKPYGNVDYADPGYQSDGKKRYPIDTKEHVKAALSYIGQTKNAAKYSAGDLAKVKAKIHAAAKKFGIGAGKEEDSYEPEDVERRRRQLQLAESD